MSTYNFSPGPAVLPEVVRREVQEAVGSFASTGMGLLEVSHRGPAFEEVITSAEARVRRLLNVPEDYAVMFCHGGATMQFSMVPLNLAQGSPVEPEYLISGVWSQKALDEAQRLTGAKANGTSEGEQFKHLPEILDVAPGTPYLHYTSNNSIYGTQWWPAPKAPVPLACDASSDLFSRPIDVAAHGAIYACAQKNFGCAGLTLAIVRNDLIDRAPKNLPILLSYRTYSNNRSLYNTPATFAVFVTERYLAWIEAEGGIAEMERRSIERAERVYRCIDEHSIYQSYASPEHRSRMNATFHLQSPDLEKQFLAETRDAGLLALKGHKHLGGIRVSMYNGLEMGAIDRLVTFMKDFASRWDS